jgi:hypothetical protein
MTQHNDSNDQKPPYEVGYCKPPKHTRFQREGGNKKGRKPGSISMQSDLEAELKSYIPMSENGQKKKIRKGRAVVKKLVHDAIMGDAPARKLLFEISKKSGTLRDEGPQAESGVSITLIGVDVPKPPTSEENG